MRLYSTLILIIILSFSTCLKSQSEVEVILSFENLSAEKGFVMVLVQDENEKDVSKHVLPVKNKKAITTVKLKMGQYGVSAYHDENSNEKLDVNLFGAPTEPYGFSNDARGTFSKPDYIETLVSVSKNQTITFKLE